ncbi:hypothetical protein ABT309_38350 [Streptomyces microflavus]|uniref:hypothetical protein n=1 Tax=Streptomyces TaxID=1883 RepID=UPI0029BC6D37|nr:hypothetical protein [Streptomyces sp. NRRL_B-2249]MDX2982202.1 hypothetical protein [Streptomyces sp. NRRL_B-2249]
MSSRPEQRPTTAPVHLDRTIEQLLAAAGHNVAHRRADYKAAQEEARRVRRRVRRARRLALRRALPRYARRTATVSLVLCGLVAIAVGLVLLSHGAPGSVELFGTAAAAWGLAAALRR